MNTSIRSETSPHERRPHRPTRRLVLVALAAFACGAVLLLFAGCGGGREAGVSSKPASAPRAPASGDVGAEYGLARAATLEAGREAVEALLSGDTAPVYARFSHQLKGLLSEQELRVALRELRRERVFFEIAEANAAFGGSLKNGVISGLLANAEAVGTFSLENGAAKPAAPLVGRWNGRMVIAGKQLAIAVNFEREGAELSATVDIPEQGVSGMPLTNVHYEPSVEIGERSAEIVLAHSPQRRIYASKHAWGSGTIVFTFEFDGSGTIVDLDEPHVPAALPPDPARDTTSATALRLPFDGPWLVSSGGPTELQSHHVVAPAQRHASDLVIWRHGGTYRGDGRENPDYWAWGQPVLAPADGTVVAVLDGIPDNRPRVTNTAVHPAGNHVVLETETGEFLYLAHFRRGSIRVEEGDRVATGAVLGLTGNSGNSFEPHIHIHLQNERAFFSQTAIGLPLRFTDYVVNGKSVSVGSPVRGDLVQNGEEG